MCSIVWLKDGHLLDTNNNPLYYLETQEYKPDLRKNDFESIESTLVSIGFGSSYIYLSTSFTTIYYVILKLNYCQ